jgi:hypothetical protein
MRVWKTRITIVAVIILLPLEITLLVALWPYLPIVGRAIAGTIVVACLCASVTMASWTWRRLRAPHLIVERDVVVMLMRDGSYHHLSAEQEAAKQLPAPRVTVSETDQGKPTAGELEVLTYLSQGKSQRVVADVCGISQTKVSEIKRRWQAHTGMVD